MSLASGATFAGYTIVGLLGRGAMGEVYLVDHPRLPRRDALKILSEPHNSDSEFRERFIREADAAAKLYHPHIVEVHDRGEFGGRLWIAMDYVDGVDLAQLIADRFPAGMPTDQALAIVTAIADALDYAHQRGLVHRDVKPANILLTRPEYGERRILLSDFGVARQLADPEGLTATNLTLGTVAYAAPEQLMGAGVDARADQYALAASAFQLLTGAPPFVGDNPVVVISQHLTAAPPRLSDRRSELQRLDEVMSTALAKDPVDRFGGCRKFADALSQRAGVATGNLSPEGALPSADTMPRIEVASGNSEQLKHRLATSRFVSPRRLWITLGSVAAICAVLAVVLLAAAITRKHDNGPASSATATAPPSFPAAPTTSVSRKPVEPPQLNGTYRVEANRSHQTYNDISDPQPPDVVTWWAFRSTCLPTGCVATGVMLDDSHQAPAPGTAAMSLDFIDDHWQSRPQTLRFPCVNAEGRGSKQTTTQVLSLQSYHGSLRGELTISVGTNECGQQGGVIRVPTVLTRMGDVPADIDIPDPGTPTTTTPTR
jgi:serine/threonine-protein kinase